MLFYNVHTTVIPHTKVSYTSASNLYFCSDTTMEMAAFVGRKCVTGCCWCPLIFTQDKHRCFHPPFGSFLYKYVLWKARICIAQYGTSNFLCSLAVYTVHMYLSQAYCITGIRGMPCLKWQHRLMKQCSRKYISGLQTQTHTLIFHACLLCLSVTYILVMP